MLSLRRHSADRPGNGMSGHGSTLGKFRYLTSGHGRNLCLVLVWGVVNACLIGLAQPLALKLLFDQGVIAQRFATFVAIAVASFVAFALWRAADYLQSLALYRVRNRIMASLSGRLIDASHRLSYADILTRGEGYYVSRLHDDASETIQKGLTLAQSLTTAVGSAVSGLVVLSVLSWRLAIPLTVVAFGFQRISRRFRRRILDHAKSEQEAGANLRSVVTKIVRATRSTRMFQMTGVVRRRYQEHLELLLSTGLLRTGSSKAYSCLIGIFSSWVEMGLIVGAGFEVMQGRMTFGGYVAFTTAFWFVSNSIRRVSDALPDLSKMEASLDRIIELATSTQSSQGERSADGDIILEDVTFSYGDHPGVRGIDATISRGERVLILGPNGSGKSTVAHLLSGSLQPTAGRVTLPERISALVEPLAFPPAPILSILEDREPSKIEAMASSFGVLECLESEFDELSAGQRRKVALLIALTFPAECYVLDEPLANVDDASKAVIMAAIERESEGKTLLVVMHGDEQFYRMFDRIIRLVDGLVESVELPRGGVGSRV